jgi:uncharacterized protein GlcG (DUF336 family)
MEKKSINQLIENIISEVVLLIPEYLASTDDFKISQGNVAICIIDEEGNTSGKLFGSNKVRSRESYRVAWTKASQVWITGINTGEYEKLVFTNQINPHEYGINLPDLIGWEGGQVIQLPDKTKISVGFSGFRGTSDIEIVLRAFRNAATGFSE